MGRKSHTQARGGADASAALKDHANTANINANAIKSKKSSSSSIAMKITAAKKIKEKETPTIKATVKQAKSVKKAAKKETKAQKTEETIKSKTSFFNRIKSIKIRKGNRKLGAESRPAISSPKQPRPLNGLRTTPRKQRKFGFGNNNFSTSPRRLNREHSSPRPGSSSSSGMGMGSGVYSAMKMRVSPRTVRAYRKQQRADGRARMKTAPTSEDQAAYEAMQLNRIPPADAVRQFARSNMRQRKIALKELRRNTLPAPANGSGSPFVAAASCRRTLADGSGGIRGRGRFGVGTAAAAAAAAENGRKIGHLGSRRVKVSTKSARREGAPKVVLENAELLPTPPATPEPNTAPARGFPGFELNGMEWPETPTAAGDPHSSTTDEVTAGTPATPPPSFAADVYQRGIEKDEEVDDSDGEVDADALDYADSDDDDYDDLNDSEIEV